MSVARKITPFKKKVNKLSNPPVPPYLAVIDKDFPNKAGLNRVIHPLWSNFYRINYHDKYINNFVRKSFFVLIKEDKAIEVKSEVPTMP